MTIREATKIVGTMTAYSAEDYGKAHIKAIEGKKLGLGRAVKILTKMQITGNDLEDIYWWLAPLHAVRKIRYSATVQEILQALVRKDGARFRSVETGGRFTQYELETMHINPLELKAIEFGLKSLYNGEAGPLGSDLTIQHLGHILIKCEASSEVCIEVAQEIWAWAERGFNATGAAH